MAAGSKGDKPPAWKARITLFVWAVVLVFLSAPLFDARILLPASPFPAIAAALYSIGNVPFIFAVWNRAMPQPKAWRGRVIAAATSTFVCASSQFLRTAFGPAGLVTELPASSTSRLFKIVYSICYLVLMPVLYFAPLWTFCSLFPSDSYRARLNEQKQQQQQQQQSPPQAAEAATGGGWSLHGSAGRRLSTLEKPAPPPQRWWGAAPVLYTLDKWSVLFKTTLVLMTAATFVFVWRAFGADYMLFMGPLTVMIISIAFWFDKKRVLRGKVLMKPDPGYMIFMHFILQGTPIASGALLLRALQATDGFPVLQFIAVMSYHGLMYIVKLLFAVLADGSARTPDGAVPLQLALLLTAELFAELVFVELDPFSPIFFTLLVFDFVRAAMSMTGTWRRIAKRLLMFLRSKLRKTDSTPVMHRPSTPRFVLYKKRRFLCWTWQGVVSRGDPLVKAKRIMQEWVLAEQIMFADEAAAVCVLVLTLSQWAASETGAVPTTAVLRQNGRGNIAELAGALFLVVCSVVAAGVAVRRVYRARVAACLEAATESAEEQTAALIEATIPVKEATLRGDGTPPSARASSLRDLHSRSKVPRRGSVELATVNPLHTKEGSGAGGAAAGAADGGGPATGGVEECSGGRNRRLARKGSGGKRRSTVTAIVASLCGRNRSSSGSSSGSSGTKGRSCGRCQLSPAEQRAAGAHARVMQLMWSRHWWLLAAGVFPAMVWPVLDQWFQLQELRDRAFGVQGSNATEIITEW